MEKILEVDHYIDGFTYLKPILTEPKYNKYIGLSIEEIREQYGDEEAQWVYFMATQGVDLTKPQFTPPKSKLVIKIEYEQSAMDHKVDLISTTGERFTLFTITIANPQILPQDVELTLERELYYHLRRLGKMGVKPELLKAQNHE